MGCVRAYRSWGTCPTNKLNSNITIFSLENEKYAFLESSYPIEKGFSGILTTSFFSQYNCLRFSYHMYGKNIGRLNVFGPDSDGGNKTLLWRIAGDQGNEWQYGLVKLKHDSSQDFYEVSLTFFDRRR